MAMSVRSCRIPREGTSFSGISTCNLCLYSRVSLSNILAKPSNDKNFCRGLREKSRPLVNLHSSSGTVRTSFVVRAGGRYSKQFTRSAQDSVEKLVKTLCESEDSVLETLDENSRWVKPLDWFNILEGIGRRRQWLLALEVFRWIQVQKWYTPDNGYYAKLISIMGKERQYRLAMIMFREMKKVGCRPDTSLYNSLMTVFLRNEDKKEGFDKACKLLEEMKKMRRCQPNVVTYNILSRASAQLGNDEFLKFLFRDMFVRDLTPDHYTYNGIMDAYGKAEEIIKMEEIFKQMRDEKLKPDLITFNTLVDSYGKAGEFEKMEQVLASMRLKRTPPMTPAVRTFNSIITNYGNAGLVEKFECVFGDMKEMGVRPTFLTHEALIGAYGRCGLLDKMEDALKTMKESGFTAQTTTLNKMLDVYCHLGKIEEAEDLLFNSKRVSGVGATSLSYGIVIRAHIAAGQRGEVLALLERMKSLNLKPTKETFVDVMAMIGMDTDFKRHRDQPTAGSISELVSESIKDTNPGVLDGLEDMIVAAA